MKACRQCGKTKPLADFYTHKKMADGHLNKCKECVKSRVTSHRMANVERIREYDRSRSQLPHRRRHLATNARKWRTANPEGYAAHTKLNNAIRDGKVTRLPCEVCSSDKSHAHHDDYSKPLEVRWLCAEHHAAHHQGERQ